MLLQLSNVEAGYGQIQVLFGVSLHVNAGEAIGLIGRNGMGRTTTVNSILGMCERNGGEIVFEDERIDRAAPHRISRLGIGLVPEGRRIFPNLTVRENLLVAARKGRGGSAWTRDRVLELFPRLRERWDNAGNQLSGGEQQMLAIGRALMTNPSLLILDEATEGLAPLIREEIWSILANLKQAGIAMIVIDKEVEAVSRVADRQYILEKGRVAWEGSSAELMQDEPLRQRYLCLGEELA
jgi:branched-chain amino acid transport system ATP-binding protein